MPAPGQRLPAGDAHLELAEAEPDEAAQAHTPARLADWARDMPVDSAHSSGAPSVGPVGDSGPARSSRRMLRALD